MVYDCLVIGGGVVGCAVLRELSKFELACVLLEKEYDVSAGATRANSGIVHAGYDAEPGTLKARMNIAGNAMFEALCNELDVPFVRAGSFVVCGDTKEERSKLERLLERGKKNGVCNMEIVSGGRLRALEPNLTGHIALGLFAPSAAVVSPYELAIALAEQAMANGAAAELNCKVTAVSCGTNGIFTVKTSNGKVFEAKTLINTAGAGAEEINNLVGGEPFKLSFARGDYYILDKTERRLVSRTVFPLPTELGKGILITPTADGNILLGPTSVSQQNANTATTAEGLLHIKKNVTQMINGINFSKVIRVFSGVRAICGNDFIIRKEAEKNIITLAGICSPGLTSAPAIAKFAVENLIEKTGIKLRKKPNFLPRKKYVRVRDLTPVEHGELCRKNPAYAKIVCRCELVSEGEILDALRSPLAPRSLDALKRRTRIGMGRCQGGFCTTRIMQIIAKETGTALESVTKCGKTSEIAPVNIFKAEGGTHDK